MNLEMKKTIIFYTVFWCFLGISMAQKGVGSLSLKISPLPNAEFTAPINPNNLALVQFNNMSQLATTYTWIFGDGKPNSNLASPLHLFPKVDTSYLVTLLATNSCGTDTIQKIVNLNCSSVNINANIIADGPLTFCEGKNVQLSTTFNQDYRYIWLLNGGLVIGANQYYISAWQSGIYQVIVEDGNGCKVQTSPVNVNVLSKPSNTITPISPILCTGESTNISVQEGHATYLWNNGATTSTINIQTGGAYNVTITGNNGCIAVTPPATAVEYPKPKATLQGTMKACKGDTINLTVSTDLQNCEFNWSTGNKTNSSSFVETTQFSVTVTSVYGCSSVVGPKEVLILDKPIAQISPQGSTTICEGKTVQLNAALTGNTFKWSTGESGTSTITVNKSGFYQYTVTNNITGCTNISAPIEVNVVSNPTVQISGENSFCEGNSVLLEAISSQSNLTYAWSTGEKLSKIYASNSGDYAVTVTNSNGCIGSYNNFIVNRLELPNSTIRPNKKTAICEGVSIELDAEVLGKNYTYQWNTGATTAKISTTVGGSYQVTVFNGICSSIVEPITITVNPNPNAMLISSGSDEFCEGSSKLLSVGNFSGDMTVIWQDGSTNKEFLATKGGDYFFTITNSLGCSAKSQVKTLTLLPNPIPVIDIANPFYFCEGSTISLATNLPDNFLYQWSNGSSNKDILVSTPGNYTVTVTDKNGCKGASPSVNLIMYPNPNPKLNINGIHRIIAGQMLTIQPTKSYKSYLWNNGATTQTVTTNLSDDYWLVDVKDENGCNSKKTSDTVRILVKPTLSLLNGVLQGVAAPNALNGQYRWYNNGQLILGAISTVYQPFISGKYQIEAFYPNGSKDISDQFDYIYTKVDDIVPITVFELFPNPVSDILWLSWKQIGSEKDIELRISDNIGKKYTSVKNPNAVGHSIDVTTWPNGAYIATLYQNGGIVSSKAFIIQH